MSRQRTSIFSFRASPPVNQSNNPTLNEASFSPSHSQLEYQNLDGYETHSASSYQPSRPSLLLSNDLGCRLIRAHSAPTSSQPSSPSNTQINQTINQTQLSTTQPISVDSATISITIDQPTIPNQATNRQTWTEFFASLPNSPLFLHKLSIFLLVVHSINLSVNISVLIYAMIINYPFTTLPPYYLIYQSINQIAIIVMICYRSRYPECWKYDSHPGQQASDQSVKRIRHYHILDGSLKCLSIALSAVLLWWLIEEQSDVQSNSQSSNDEINVIIYMLIGFEFSTVVAPIVLNVFFAFFFPCAALSFFLPYLPNSQSINQNGQTNSPPVGLTEQELTQLPRIQYNESINMSNKQCCICLLDYSVGDELRILSCQHNYHQDCIDRWLVSKPHCPLCIRKVTVPSLINQSIEQTVNLPIDDSTPISLYRSINQSIVHSHSPSLMHSFDAIAMVPTIRQTIDTTGEGSQV